MTALLRAERFTKGVLDGALTNGLLTKILDRLLKWRDPTTAQ
jgi:hypothetical protein